ncbi:opioid growth factor receptor [Vipera latastei]
MAARMRAGKEKDRASEGEEEEEEKEEEEEDDGGLWEYDSTWEDEEEGKEEEEEGRREKKSREPPSQAAHLEECKAREKHSWWPTNPKWASATQSINRRNWNAARDMQKYRRHYPGLRETEVSEEEMWNLSFYKNEINFLPRGLYIEDLLETWQDNYGVLEENHSYIQWLFPLREQGMNFYAKRLTCQEIEAFKKSKEVMERFIRAYKLMLKFYGISLVSEETGELEKAENWCERFGNLNRYSHNNLRITRILKCLGEMGYEHYQVQLVKFFLIETLVHQMLPRVLRSVLDYFMFTVRHKLKRRELVYFAWQHFKPKHEFVWGPPKKLRRFKPQSSELLSNPEEQEHTKKGDGVVVEKDNVESPQAILQRLTGRKSSGQEEAGEALEKEKHGLSEESCVAHYDLGTTIHHNHVEQPVTSISATLSLSASNSMQDKGIGRRALDGDLMQDGEFVEPQLKPVDDYKTSKRANQSHLALGEKEAKGDSEEGRVASDCPLERKDCADECVGEAEGENLKEAKKRKLELNRLSGEIPEASKSSNDIERISQNLGEVVITKEEISFLAPKGGSEEESRDRKEVESLDAVRKRRKVDIAPKDDSSEVGSELIPSKDQGASCSIHDVKETDLVCQEETKMAANPSADTLIGHKAGGVDGLADSKKNDHPGDSRLLEKVNEQEATAPTESDVPWLSETITVRERGVRNNAGWKEQDFEETSDGFLERNEISKIKEHVNTTAGPEEE